MEVVVHATGHEHVSARHASTFEVTSDDWLTPAGDCIVGVEADTVPSDLPEEFVDACRDPDATVVATLRVRDDRASGEHEAVVTGRGHPDLTFEDGRSFVFRTSDHVDDRTAMIGADAAATDLDRELIAALADGADLELVLRVE